MLPVERGVGSDRQVDAMRDDVKTASCEVQALQSRTRGFKEILGDYLHHRDLRSVTK